MIKWSRNLDLLVYLEKNSQYLGVEESSIYYQESSFVPSSKQPETGILRMHMVWQIYFYHYTHIILTKIFIEIHI